MKQKESIGAFVRVPIDDKFHTYGRIICEYRYAFYDFRTDIIDPDLSKIQNSDILFKLIVHKNAVTKGFWKIIGKLELPDELKKPLPFFIQNVGNYQDCLIDINGVRKEATLSECYGLERLAIWDHMHVEQRLRDHYNNKPNNYSNALQLKMK